MNEYRKYIIVFIFAFLISNQKIYPQYVFRHMDVVNGLPDNQIRSFSETPDGRIVIRTLSSLNIYNGATFESFYLDKLQDYQWSFTRFFKEYYDIEGRIWMKSPGYLSLFDLKYNRFIKKENIEDQLASMGVKSRLKNFFIDNDKNYWFLTEDNTFLLYNIIKKELTIIDEGNGSFTKEYGIPYELAQHKNLCWILYSSGLLRCWDTTSEEFIFQDTQFMGKISEITDRISICPTVDGNLWIMVNSVIFYYDKTHHPAKKIATIEGTSNFFTSLSLDINGNVWAGTSWSGLRKIDHHTHKVEIISPLKLNKGGTLSNDIQSVYVDRNNGTWIGTLWQGLCYYHPSMQKFELIQTSESNGLTSNESVRCFLEDEDGTILIGTTANGLYRYNPITGQKSKAFGGQINDICLSLYRDKKNRIWVGTFLNGFYCIDGNKITNYNRQTSDLDTNPLQNVSRAIFEDDSGRYWVSIKNGVGELNLQTGKITMLQDKHPEIQKYKDEYGFYQIDNKNFIVYGLSGIYYYNFQDDSVYVPDDDKKNPKFKNSSTVYHCIYKDSRNLEWFGTDLGIRVWDEKYKKLYTIDIENGLPNNSISAIVEDNNGEYWVSYANGISKIQIDNSDTNVYKFILVNFDTHDGLQSGRFYENSFLKAKDGILYFGGFHGFNRFDPSLIKYNQSKNKPVFVTFKLFNSVIKQDISYNGHVILKEPINNTTQIKLNYNENFISFEFAGLNYVNPTHTYYKYKLENYDKDWIELSTTGIGTATYTGLAPGEYNLIVYTANNDKVWGTQPAEISIIITPPFWATKYAYIFYTLLTICIIYVVFRHYSKRYKIRLAELQVEESRKQKEELDDLKFRFFTNISHEFRTPLTLIMTPLSTLIRKEKDERDRQSLNSIYRNAEDMLELINQLLDFRKLEMSGEKLKLSFDDIIRFSEYIFATFKEIAEDKSVGFTFENDIDQVFMWFDKEKIRKILNNLYSNAFKFTKEGGHISTEIRMEEHSGRQYIKVSIIDTGCGIPKEELQIIFERFYQSNNNISKMIGSGIGLHLVREYVEMHDGYITVNSEVNMGSTFSVLIPTDLEDDKRLQTQLISEQNNQHKEKKEKRNILVVEDNTEFRQFLVGQLNEQFNVSEASNGEEGEIMARKKNPDLIISDLMMPKVDGLELCRRLKNDIQTSHISIILLTARLSDEAKIESYKAGADSYIAKPFNYEVLQARIDMLIEQQNKRKKLFQNTLNVEPDSITTTSLDEEFIKKALLLIEKNIDNPDYSNDDLSGDLGMSRSSLYPKFQSITGQTPNHFIRSIRLKKAAQLLQISQYNISEIAWMVGFNDIKYFNKYFKEDFGKTPTQYRIDTKSKD